MAGSVISEFVVLEATLEERRLQVEAALRRLHQAGHAPGVAAAIEHSLFGPAKRLRPILSLLVAEVLRGDIDQVLPPACAIEMVHTASLILDDLPSMDDASSRRGRPACHIVHGEATAILAAFALQNRAFAILAEGWPGGPGAETRAAVARDLAHAVGLEGMIAGQAQDLAGTDRTIDFPTLEFIHSRKTGALFTAAAALGALAARPGERAAIISYAKNLGLAFQIVDDLIDVGGVEAEAGKDVGKDLKKTTFVSFSGVEGARDLARELIATAQEALAGFGSRAQPLRDLARYVVTRGR
ncbi:MAG TPA: polyprenyl synthetase family protein [Vicinamibacteria bacterium]|jgi:geranylgeranyl diphosphate synthase type II|nr:polyprenyl synthetase family protein [Vicinamibacteria bacterium]